jgi:mono/diheme cytochrome c family protein
VAGAATAQAEAEKIFSERCVTCHGANGAGDGPASASLVPKPRNFQDPAWQKSVSDEHIEQIVQYGGAAVGKSAAMPANPDLTSKPAVVAALRAHVRSLAK